MSITHYQITETKLTDFFMILSLLKSGAEPYNAKACES
ncbi:hypothetical protein LRHK_2546 [Lacticaseibacillus rhamnosus ATCC 8530]|nr:hypothetical protein LRHK_2546 [Lacticaseibacillus rhamnosus ATCC 8530]